MKFDAKLTPNSARAYLGGGRRERLGATCLSPGLIQEFAAFTASWTAETGSHSFSMANLKSATWLTGRIFSLSGRFPYSSRMVGLRFQCKSPYLGKAATWLAPAGSQF